MGTCPHFHFGIRDRWTGAPGRSPHDPAQPPGRALTPGGTRIAPVPTKEGSLERLGQNSAVLDYLCVTTDLILCLPVYHVPSLCLFLHLQVGLLTLQVLGHTAQGLMCAPRPRPREGGEALIVGLGRSRAGT